MGALSNTIHILLALTPTSLFILSVQKLLSHVKSTLKWRLMDRQPLETWVHSAGRVTLLGDACHPMLVGNVPYDCADTINNGIFKSLTARRVRPWQLRTQQY